MSDGTEFPMQLWAVACRHTVPSPWPESAYRKSMPPGSVIVASACPCVTVKLPSLAASRLLMILAKRTGACNQIDMLIEVLHKRRASLVAISKVLLIVADICS